jgi:hypothetical protein
MFREYDDKIVKNLPIEAGKKQMNPLEPSEI